MLNGSSGSSCRAGCGSPARLSAQGARRATRRRPVAALCAGALALALTSSAQAQPTGSSAGSDAQNLDLARSVAVTGREAFNAGDYETALALFRRAYSLYAAPTVVLYEARTLEKMGLLIEAIDAYDRTTLIPVPPNAPAQFTEAVAAAREERDALAARVPTLRIDIQGAAASDPDLFVTINGRAVSADDLGRAQRLNPGTYRIVGSIGANRRATADVTLLASASRRVDLNLAPPVAVATPPATIGAEPAPERRIPFLAIVAGGVGVAGVSAGVISGLLANREYDNAERLCDDHVCVDGTSGPDAVNAFRTWRMVSSVSYGVGAAGIAAGIVLWLTASDDSEPGQAGTIEPWGTAKTAGIRGTF